MKPIRLLLAALPLLLPPLACDAGETGPEALASAMLEALRQTSGVPGLAAAVWQDGHLLWQGQAGWHDMAAQRPLSPDSRFRLASVSKLFTATAAALLHQEGRLDGESPLPQPWYPPNHPGAQITPRHLSAHLSGLPHYQAFDLTRGGRAFADSRSAAGHWLNGRALRDTPGRGYHYSSWGYTMLGAAIETASGMPLDRFLETRLTQGLAIGVDRSDSDPDGHSRPYERRAGDWRLASAHDYSYSLGGAGLSATPGALAQWGGRVLQGQLLEAETLAWMTRPSRLVDGTQARHEGRDPVAFGWRLHDDLQGHRTWYHNGSAIGARSTLVLWPGEPATAAALLSNASWVSSIDESARSLAAAFRWAEQNAASTTCPAVGQRFTLQWGNDVLQGTVHSALQGAPRCVRDLRLDKSAKAFDNQGPPRPQAALRLLSMDDGADLARAALATPIGLFILRANEGGDLLGHMAGRPARLSLSLARGDS